MGLFTYLNLIRTNKLKLNSTETNEINKQKKNQITKIFEEIIEKLLPGFTVGFFFFSFFISMIFTSLHGKIIQKIIVGLTSSVGEEFFFCISYERQNLRRFRGLKIIFRIVEGVLKN